MSDQTQRVTDEAIAVRCEEAEAGMKRGVPAHCLNENYRIALDLRDLRAAHAATLAECEHEKAEFSKLSKSWDALRAELATVLRREADTIARNEAKLDGLEARNEKLRAALNAVHEQFECPARNTNRGRAFREGVMISNDVREQVAAALTEDQPHA
jgi:hypothetical protein